MKTKIMFYLLLVALFVFAGNSFAIEEAEESIAAVKEPRKVNAPAKYDETIGSRGYEGYNNTLYGKDVGSSLTDGIDNSFFGRYAGQGTSGGDNNSFFGRSAGGSNTTGNNNSFFGRSAGLSNTEGDTNSFFGRAAGYSNTSGDFNSFFGAGAGSYNTIGNNNSFFGSDAGYANKTGDFNVFLGYRAGFQETGSHKLYIDSSETNKPLIWGDFNTNEVRIHGGFKALAIHMSSDQRWKKNIQPLESSLEKISNLQGVSYEWKIDEYPDVGMKEGKQIGLVAQDVEKEIPELVSEDKDGYKAVSYTKLTAVLVEAVKELKAENQSQKNLIEEQRILFRKQQTEIEELRALIKEFKT